MRGTLLAPGIQIVFVIPKESAESVNLKPGADV